MRRAGRRSSGGGGSSPSGFPCRRHELQAAGLQDSLRPPGLAAPRRVGSARNPGSSPGLLLWQAGALPPSPQGSPPSLPAWRTPGQRSLAGAGHSVSVRGDRGGSARARTLYACVSPLAAALRSLVLLFFVSAFVLFAFQFWRILVVPSSSDVLSSATSSLLKSPRPSISVTGLFFLLSSSSSF